MKKSFLKIGSWRILILCILLFTKNLSAQVLFIYQQSVILNEKQQHFANVWKKEVTTGAYSIISIDQNLFKGNSVTLQLPDGVAVTLNRDKIETRDNIASWNGSNKEELVAGSFVIHNGMVTAMIYAGINIYLIYPLGEGLHIIYKSKPENYQHDESDEGYRDMIQRGMENSMQQIHYDSESNQFVTQDMGIAADCKVRVLVGYTQQCANNLADIPGFIQSCINATNIAYANSAVNFQCELARSILLNYNETFIADTDLLKFRTPSDGIMDNVADLRNYYDADLCILIIDTMLNNLCGLASAIGPTSDGNAYCVVARGCAVGNLSFPHELGHLYGCRHDPFVDNTNSPYPYGHGYVYISFPNTLWRTIMAYNDQCDCADERFPCPAINFRNTPGFPSCTRLQYFSNPNINYLGQPMGTVATNDNQLALDVSVPLVASLEPYINNKAIPYEVVFDNEDGDLLGATSVENSDVYLVMPSANMQWRAGSYIDLKTNFWALEGSTFSAFIESCASLRLEDNSPEAQQLNNSVTGVQVYPNPFIETTDLYFNLDKPSTVSAYLTNFLGEKIKVLLGATAHDAGTYKISVDGKKLSAGVYFLVLERGNEKTVTKIVRVQ